MKIIPKLTRQRLSELPEGTPIKIGSLCVIFDGCSIEPDLNGRNETVVNYTDEHGNHRRFSEWVILQSATEFTESDRCKYCGHFRQPGDTKRVLIRFWNRTEQHTFCTDRDCAGTYQQSIRVSAKRPAHGRWCKS